jgi:hypothetical protein
MTELEKKPFNLVAGDELYVVGFSFDRIWSPASHVDTEGLVLLSIPEVTDSLKIIGLSPESVKLEWKGTRFTQYMIEK